MAEKSMTITLSGDIIERLQPKDEQDLTRKIEEIVRQMSDSEGHAAREVIRPARLQENPEERIQALMAAIDGFWGDMSEEDIQESIDAMNAEYVNPDDLTLFDWIDDLPEDER